MNSDNRIHSYREIVCNNPYEKVWEQLYYFTDGNRVNKNIRRRANLQGNEHDGNVKKQAKQVAFSIKQADSYFRAAQEVDASVKPNLIYYGMSSLAYAVVLYTNDGEFSLDALRKKKQERHHGLELKCTPKKQGTAKELLECIGCKIYEDKGNLYGHFKNFYESIAAEFIFVKNGIVEVSEPGTFHHMEALDMYRGFRRIAPMYSADKKEVGQLRNSLNLLTLLKFLPDMVEQLSDNDIQSNLYPGAVNSILYVQDLKDNQASYQKIRYAIYNLSDHVSEYFRSLYLQNSGMQLEVNTGSALDFSFDSRRELEANYKPDLAQDIFGNRYFIFDVEKYVLELANLYICFFCMGMLCRYYPDFWMCWLEENVGFRLIVDSLCSIAIRKFPNLVLNQLTQCINHFHL